MKLELALLALLLTSGVLLFTTQSSDSQEQELYAQYLQYRIDYNRNDNSDYRFNIFKENMAFIKKYNSENTLTVLGIGPFTDMTNEEYNQKNNLHISSSQYDFEEIEIKDVDLNEELQSNASYLNWVDKGAVTSVKDQGQCGSCWSFGAMGTTEGAYQVAGNQLTSFSEQYIVSCNTAYGCGGGMIDYALKWSKKFGLALNSDYPYTSGATGKDGQCYDTPLISQSIKDIYRIAAQNPNALKGNLEYRPIAVSLNASGSVFQNYQSGVLTGAWGATPNHAVTMVGYSEGGNVNYWILKNSWGTSWGEGGYFNVEKSTSGPGYLGITKQPQYFAKF